MRLDGDYVDIRDASGAYDATPEEEALLRRFMPESTAERRTLADIIMEKLKEAQGSKGSGGAADASGMTDSAGGGAAAGGAAGRGGGDGSLDSKVIEVYTEVSKAAAVSPPHMGP